MQDHAEGFVDFDLDSDFGYEVDDFVDQLDRAYQDGRDDLGNQVIELIRDYEAEDYPPEAIVKGIVRFIENSMASYPDDMDDPVTIDELLAEIDSELLEEDPYFLEAA